MSSISKTMLSVSTHDLPSFDLFNDNFEKKLSLREMLLLHHT